MLESEPTLTSALSLIKRFVDAWLDRGSSPDLNNLAALLDALDVLKETAQQKLYGDASVHVEERQPNPNARTLRSGTIRREQPKQSRSAFQGRVPRNQHSNPNVSNSRHDISTSLFIPENDTNSAGADRVDYEQRNPIQLPQDPTERQALNGHNAESLAPAQQNVEQGRLPPSPKDAGPGASEQDETAIPSPQFFEEAFNNYIEEAGALTQPDIDRMEHGPGSALESLTQLHTHAGEQDEIAIPSPQFFEEAFNNYIEEAGALTQPDIDRMEHEPGSALESPLHTHAGEQDVIALPSPRFFEEAFNDPYGEPLQLGLLDLSQDSVIHSHGLDTDMVDQPFSFSDDPMFKEYLELACRSDFRLPQDSVYDGERLPVPELLLPLMEEIPLTTRLLHGLLYTLLPGSLRIWELKSSDCDESLSLDKEPEDNFAVIIPRTENAPLLVLGDSTTKVLFVLGTTNLPVIEAFRSQLTDWKEETIDPHVVAPHIESTLLSVHIAEACFRYRLPVTEIPSSRDLRLRFLGELMAPYERDSVLEQCGIHSNVPFFQRLDVRTIEIPRTQGQANEISIPNIDNFDMRALQEAFLNKPTDMTRGRCLRILQCVNEIGSPHILDSLKSALASIPGEVRSQDVEQPIVEKLFNIHLFLDKQESKSHLSVARNRYVKYCYFETYLLAVKALQDEKRSSNREQRKISALKLTASYKQGLCEELPPTPHTDNILHIYKDLSHAERRKRAPDMVKEEIARKVLKIYKGDGKRVKQKITRYIREGKVLHHILQGSVCLNPGLLILFPSWESQAPSLNVNQFGLELQQNECKSLSRAIDIKDIDGLTQLEATWFGKVLQTRPALLERIPKTVLNIISNSLAGSVDLQERDPDSFIDRPLHFFA